MVLAAVTFLVLAVIMLTSFAITNAVQERIRLQSHADATAFSVATLEARALNVVAYQNRAFTATAVTMMSLHAWMALSTMQGRLALTLYKVFKHIHSVHPDCPVPPPVPAPPPDCTEGTQGPHYECDHKALAEKVMLTIEGSLDGLNQALQALDRPFNDTMKIASAALRHHQQSQVNAVTQTYGAVGSSGDPLYGKLAATNGLPPAAYDPGIFAVNQQEFACAVVGVPGLTCKRFVGPNPDTASAPFTLTTRSSMARAAANAARSQLEAGCGDEPGNYGDYTYGTPGDGKRKCSLALHKALQPSAAPTGWGANNFSNIYRYLLNDPGQGDDNDAKVDFNLFAWASISDPGIGSETYDSRAIRMTGTVQREPQPTTGNMPESAMKVTGWHGHTYSEKDFWTEGGLPDVPAPNTHYDLTAGIASEAVTGWAHFPCVSGNAAETPKLLCNAPAYSAGPPAFDPTPYDTTEKTENGKKVQVHDLSEPHDFGETHWEGICNPDRPASVCFVNFASDSRPETDYGQPSVYVALKGFLSPVPPGSTFKPWELNAQGKVEVEFMQGAPKSVINMKPRYGKNGVDEAYVVSKAKVYYHEFGSPWYFPEDWKRPPNLFDPFWRAKLHPFRAAEKRELLKSVNDTKGDTLLGGIAVNPTTGAPYGERE